MHMDENSPELNCVTVVQDSRAIWEALNAVKKQATDRQYTNFYVSDVTLRCWIRQKELTMIRYPSSVFLLRQRNGFQFFWFTTVDYHAFEKHVEQVVSVMRQPLSTPFLHTSDEYLPVRDVLLQHGFERYRRIFRMQRIQNTPSPLPLQSTAFANEDDAEEVAEMLHANFNPLADQIPDLEEIRWGAHEHQILLAKNEDGHVIALFWAVRQGGVVQWRYWATRPEYRKASLAGLSLLQQALALHADAHRLLLWVDELNIRARRIYERLGFTLDGLINDTYCLTR